jgi:hypothetical protein
MSFSMASLLAHSQDVPPAARAAIRAAHGRSEEDRLELLECAAHILHQEAGVSCPEARELLDLRPEDCI